MYCWVIYWVGGMYCWVIALDWRNVLRAYSGLKDCSGVLLLGWRNLLLGYTGGVCYIVLLPGWKENFTDWLYFWVKGIYCQVILLGWRNVLLKYTTELEECTAELYYCAGGMYC